MPAGPTITAHLHWLDANQLGALTISKADAMSVYVIRLGEGWPRRITLLNAATGARYHCRLGLRPQRDRCSCPDCRYRRRACKHVQGLRQALCGSAVYG
jgi:hypothetical protein